MYGTQNDESFIEGSPQDIDADTDLLNDQINYLDSLPVESSFAHSLPIPAIMSRHACAIIFSFHSRRKEVIKLLLTISKSARAYIITQNGLRGFLLDSHINSMSWIDELRTSHSF